MRPNDVRLPANSLALDEALRSDLDALRKAKARQDVSHQKLDKWIAAAIAELSNTARQHHPFVSSAANTIGGDIGRL